MPVKNSSGSLLGLCLLITVGVHLALFTYAFRNPLFLQSSFSRVWIKGLESEDKDGLFSTQKKSLFLQEALNKITPLNQTETERLQDQLLPQEERVGPLSFSFETVPNTLSTKDKFSSFFFPSFPNNDQRLLTSQPSVDFPESLHILPFLESWISVVPLDALKRASAPLTLRSYSTTPSLEKFEVSKRALDPAILSLNANKDDRLAALSLQKREAQEPSLDLSLLPLSSEALHSDNPLLAQSVFNNNISPVEFYLPDGPALFFSDWSDYFKLDVSLLLQNEKGGYPFVLTFTPKDDLSQIQMKQNFYFLIDRSNSIEKHRFTGYKRAVLRALSLLDSNQNFNICIFDRKTILLSKTNLPANKKNCQLAKEFLSSQESKSCCTAGELCASLSKLLPETPEDLQMHLAILISDGTTSLTTQKQKEALKNFLKKNNQKVALYAATCGRDNNLALLKALTHQAGGELLYSPTHAAFARKFAQFVRNLSSPLAKNLLASVHSSNLEQEVRLLLPSSHLSALFNNRPFSLFGTVSQPTSFTVVLQGIHKNEPIVIQKEVYFDHPQKKNPQLEKAWKEAQVWTQFSVYLHSKKKEELKKAQALLRDATVSTPKRRPY